MKKQLLVTDGKKFILVDNVMQLALVTWTWPNGDYLSQGMTYSNAHYVLKQYDPNIGIGEILGEFEFNGTKIEVCTNPALAL